MKECDDGWENQKADGMSWYVANATMRPAFPTSALHRIFHF